MQLALKLVINGSYGAFANPYFVVSNKHIANSITMMGRDVILYMLQKIENYFFLQTPRPIQSLFVQALCFLSFHLSIQNPFCIVLGLC